MVATFKNTFEIDTSCGVGVASKCALGTEHACATKEEGPQMALTHGLFQTSALEKEDMFWLNYLYGCFS